MKPLRVGRSVLPPFSPSNARCLPSPRFRLTTPGIFLSLFLAEEGPPSQPPPESGGGECVRRVERRLIALLLPPIRGEVGRGASLSRRDVRANRAQSLSPID